jgi:cytidine deaminase
LCAEVAAVAWMLKHHETHIVVVVAVTDDGTPIGPCGRCREMIAQVDARDLDCRIILGHKREAKLRDLLPEHWLG